MHTPKSGAARAIAVLVLLAALWSCGLPSAGAQEGGEGWGIAPSGAGNGGERDFFVYQLKPGQGFQDVVGISNLTDEPLTFTIIARDAFNTPGDGGFALQDTDATPEDAGGWIELAADEYTVEPQSRADIPFNIVVPPNASPGDHAAGIIATLRPDESADGNDLDIRIERRIAARVYVRVAGPLTPGLAIERLDIDHDPASWSIFSGRSATISYTVRNVGNVRTAPTARLSLVGPLGGSIETFPPRVLPELLPGSTAQVTVQVDDVRPLFRITAELEVEAVGEAAASSKRSTSMWAIPWLPIALFAVAAAGYWRWRRRRRTGGTGGDVAPPSPSRPKDLVKA